MRSSLVERGWPIVAACASALVAACSLLLHTSGEQCSSDADCTALGGPFAGTRCEQSVCVPGLHEGGIEGGADAGEAGTDGRTDGGGGAEAGCDAPADGPWACLCDNPLPTPPAHIHLALTLTDFFTDNPIRSVEATACPNASDPACSTPIATLRPDDAGAVDFTLDTSSGPFTGYVIIQPLFADGGVYELDSGTDADISGIYVPSRVYYSGMPRTADFVDSRQLVSYGYRSLLSGLFQTPVDPGLGIILASTVDCTDNTIAGVSVSLDMTSSTTIAFYFSGGVPSTTATQSDSTGIAGWANVPTGARTVSARFASNQRPIGSVSMYILGGWIHYADVGPAYTP